MILARPAHHEELIFPVVAQRQALLRVYQRLGLTTKPIEVLITLRISWSTS
jgi:hypothetical protein